MNLTEIRKTFLWSFIVFLSLTALIAIISVLGGKFGDTQIKVLATTFTISAASICAMSCAAFIEKRKALVQIGVAGIAFAAVAAAMTIIVIWGEIEGEHFWKTTITLIVISVALAQTLLLWIPNLAENHKWTQTAASIFIALLALQIIFAVWREIDSEDYYRLLAVVSIVVVLLILIVPICSKLGARQIKSSDNLILSKISEGIYADQSGRNFQVTEIKTGGN